MIRKKRKIIFWIIAGFVFLNLNSSALGQKIKFRENLKADVTVVAYDIVSANEKGNTEVFFVKIDKIKKGKEKSEYIIITRFHSKDDSLIEKIINGKIEWYFGLMRAKYCDAKLRDFEYLVMKNEEGIVEKKYRGLEFIGGFNATNLPMDEMLPCYLLSKNSKILD